LVQCIDMSDKMLYNEVKAEQSFLTLINATVSHELGNPLASLIGQRDSLKEVLRGLEHVISMMKPLETTSPEIAKIVGIMIKIHTELKVTTKKIVSAAKFIDYFVHDMLDYTMLNKEEKNFVKSVSIFDIRNAIGEIVEI
jgi:signal transduction histidine kinase